MSAFELKKDEDKSFVHCSEKHDKVKQECIIALKVYDSCRQQDCLTACEIGPARAADSEHTKKVL